MLDRITYWIRINCGWQKVTTSVATWAKLPHVTGSCKVVPGLLIGLLSAPPSVPAPIADYQPIAGGYEALVPAADILPEPVGEFDRYAPASGSSIDFGYAIQPVSGATEAGILTTATTVSSLGSSILSPSSAAAGADFLPDPDLDPPYTSAQTRSDNACCEQPSVPNNQVPEPPSCLIFELAAVYALYRRRG